jgi:hypothetical protein
MKYYGIKTPKTDREESYIWWISDSEHNSWDAFFISPDKVHAYNRSRPSMETAIKAYKSIGYKCVELEVEEKVEGTYI